MPTFFLPAPEGSEERARCIHAEGPLPHQIHTLAHIHHTPAQTGMSACGAASCGRPSRAYCDPPTPRAAAVGRPSRNSTAPKATPAKVRALPRLSLVHLIFFPRAQRNRVPNVLALPDHPPHHPPHHPPQHPPRPPNRNVQEEILRQPETPRLGERERRHGSPQQHRNALTGTSRASSNGSPHARPHHAHCPSPPSRAQRQSLANRRRGLRSSLGRVRSRESSARTLVWDARQLSSSLRDWSRTSTPSMAVALTPR